MKMCYFIKVISVLTKDPLEKCRSAEKLRGEKRFDAVQFMDWGTIVGCRKSSLSHKGSMKNWTRHI